jgi:UDP-glucose 4-epimerase
VLEAARRAGVRRVVYASTIWVYSDTDGELMEESLPLSPPAHLYTATKLAGELYCRSYKELYGVESTILRFGIPYGPRARPAAVIPAFVGKALAGEPLTIAGDGLQSRRFVYVEDLADGVVRALAPAAAGGVYNLVGSDDVTVAQIADTVRGLIGDVEVVRVPGRTGDFGGAPVSGERAARELGWRPTTSFREGVRRYVEWHREAEAAALPAHTPERWPAVALTFLRRAAIAVVMAAFVGVVVIGVATLAPLDQDMDVYDTFGGAVLLLAPLVLAGAFQWEHARKRWLRAVLWTVAIGNAALLLAPWPGAVDHLGHAHHVFLLLSAISAGCAALVAGPASPRTWLAAATGD